MLSITAGGQLCRWLYGEGDHGDGGARAIIINLMR